MSKDTPTGMILAGIFATENIDTSGESISIKGLDISEIEAGTAVVNYEHKSEKDKEANGQEVVGRVLFARKIYNKSDCTNDLEEKAWEETQMPLLFGYVRLWDKAGHVGAQSLAASIRDQSANKEKIILRWSVEGSTASRDGNKLTSTIFKRITATWKPANRASETYLLADPNAPDGFEKEPVKDKEVLENTIKFENIEFSTLSSNGQLNVIEENTLNKAIEAGGGNVAPSSLTGGAVFAKEHIQKKPIKERIRELFNKSLEKWDSTEARKLIKAMLPEISDEYVKHFEDALEDLHVKRNAIKKSEILPIVRLHNLEIELRKNIDEIRVSSLTNSQLPCIYTLYYKIEGKEYRAGRFMLYNNNLTHLEDYFGMLNQMLPEGPLDFNKVSQIYNLRDGKYTRIQNEPIPLGIDPPEEGENEVQQEETQTPRAPSVWDYMRVGMDIPHTLEIKEGKAFLDGNLLTDPELNTIYSNIRTGLATIRYRAAPDANLDPLNKADGDPQVTGLENLQPADALTHVRNAVKAGHIHPEVERALTRHLYTDPRTGHGNKLAWSEFRKQNKPGAHIALDLNSFKSINDAYSHDVGDQALKTFFGHVGDAANEAAPGANKIFTPSGDEGYLYFPSHEHAASFAQGLTRRLEQTPPVQGVHKLSTTIGFGNTPEDADKASLIAKEQKYLPGQEHLEPRAKKMKFPIGQVPNLFHSLVPGREGPIQPHNATPEAIKQSLPEVKAPEAKAA